MIWCQIFGVLVVLVAAIGLLPVGDIESEARSTEHER